MQLHFQVRSGRDSQILCSDHPHQDRPGESDCGEFELHQSKILLMRSLIEQYLKVSDVEFNLIYSDDFNRFLQVSFLKARWWG